MEIKDLPEDVKKKASKLKKKWNNMYCLKIKEKYFIVRPMTRGEFLFFLDLGRYALGFEEDFVFNECVLYPEINLDDMDGSPAGEVNDISNAIIELSAFLSPESMESMILESRSKMDLADSQILATLCKAFPQLDIDAINNLDAKKISYYLAIAEEILGIKLEFQNQSQIQNQSSTINFMDENKNLRKMGGFGNGAPRPGDTP